MTEVFVAKPTLKQTLDALKGQVLNGKSYLKLRARSLSYLAAEGVVQ